MEAWIVFSVIVATISLIGVVIGYISEDRRMMAWALLSAFCCWAWPITVPVGLLLAIYMGVVLIFDEFFDIVLPNWWL